MTIWWKDCGAERSHKPCRKDLSFRASSKGLEAPKRADTNKMYLTFTTHIIIDPDHPAAIQKVKDYLANLPDHVILDSVQRDTNAPNCTDNMQMSKIVCPSRGKSYDEDYQVPLHLNCPRLLEQGFVAFDTSQHSNSMKYHLKERLQRNERNG